MRFRTRQRQARTSTRMLLGLFALVVVLLVVAVNALLALGWSALTGWSGRYPNLFFETNTAVVLLFVFGGTLVETLRLKAGGGRHVALTLGGREVREPPRDLQDKRVRNIIDEMALASGMPRPPAFVLDREDAINGLAAGWTPDDAVIAVTRGAIERLTREELQGLVAHEFGHIRQRDPRQDMVLLSMVWGLSLVHGYGRSLVDPGEDGHRNGAGVLMGIVFLVVGWAGWMAGRLLQASVSRQREYMADASAVEFTRNREGIGRALRKAWHQEEQGEARLRDERAASAASIFFAAPPAWFDRHPPLRSRVKRVYGFPVGSMPCDRIRVTTAPDEAVAAPLSRAFRPTSSGAFGAFGAFGAGSASGASSDFDRRDVRDREAERRRAWTGADVETIAVERSGSGPGSPRSFKAVGAAAAHPLARMGMGMEARSSSFGARSEDREAMGRLSLLHGPLERRSALLALLLKPWPEGPVPSGRPSEQLAAWRRESAGLGSAERVLADVRALSEAVRLPWFEKLLARTAAAPSAEHVPLMEAAARLTAVAHGPDAIDRLHLEAIRQRLQGMPSSRKPAMVDSAFATELAELDLASVRHISVVTAVLDELLPPSWHWYSTVMLEWDEKRGALDLARPDDDALKAAFAGLRTLPWMLRPLVTRLWVRAAHDRNPPLHWPRAFIDGLRLCSLALDCPLHPDVASGFTELDGPD